jgi:hypothetical protein
MIVGLKIVGLLIKERLKSTLMIIKYYYNIFVVGSMPFL